MSSDDLLKRALNLSYFFLKFRPRTEKEIIVYLNDKAKKFHLTTEIIETAVNQLKQENLINDSDFTSWYVDQRNRAKPKSRFLLTQELQRFGVAKDTIVSYFESNEPDESALAKKVILQKPSLLKNLNDKKTYQRAFNLLLRRGFSFSISQKTLDGLLVKPE